MFGMVRFKDGLDGMFKSVMQIFIYILYIYTVYIYNYDVKPCTQ